MRITVDYKTERYERHKDRLLSIFGKYAHYTSGNLRINASECLRVDEGY